MLCGVVVLWLCKVQLLSMGSLALCKRVVFVESLAVLLGVVCLSFLAKHTRLPLNPFRLIQQRFGAQNLPATRSTEKESERPSE